MIKELSSRKINHLGEVLDYRADQVMWNAPTQLRLMILNVEVFL
jgi:hypothetical protein